ncbi:hypothetical protein Dsin_016166 [Dipteronia sinensis]|uniref:Reverse transcriptase n=1 Tax=Dipteronia sinensis TaxID=43782 RepID=A0AAE0E5Q6_9ROSI|nr:hypothetical protein Dsin_016166 [Dipteronia sinensis]
MWSRWAKGSVDEDWAKAFKCMKAALPITYLGLPLGAKSSVKAFWNPLLSHIEKMLTPWKRKFLNKGGRLVLIKSVVSSIPSYFLSVFKVPVGWLKTLRKCKDLSFGEMVLRRESFTLVSGLQFVGIRNMGA